MDKRKSKSRVAGRDVSRPAEPQLQLTFAEKSAAAAAEGDENSWANSAAAAVEN